MNANTSVFVICVEVIIYLLLYNLHNCTFKFENSSSSNLTVGVSKKKFFFGNFSQFFWAIVEARIC